MKNLTTRFTLTFATLVLLASFVSLASCKSSKKSGPLRAEFRYVRSNGVDTGYTFYRFYNDNTFSRGAGGETGKQSGEIETERGTYMGDPTISGPITLTVTSTFNVLNNQWLSISVQHEQETGTVSGNTLLLNGITYVRQ
ncbi:MAG: hypothetical protein IJR49_02025 [Treponema sp.]|nr:hypothetical protein [Treponema sp.]